jgi:NADPH:quinone reductase-like Zn-dependent oxidoreductase
MKALRFERMGDLSALHIEELPVPIPASGEVLVKVHAASINPSDVKNVEGKMEGTTLPRTPGRDFAGTVVNGPAGLSGQDVWAAGGDIGFTRDGSHAEYIVIPAGGARLKPASLSMTEAASVGVNYITAYLGLVETAHVKRGEIVLVTGAKGGVGSSVAKIANASGARVIGVDREAMGAGKARELGIELSLSGKSQTLQVQVNEFTADKGVDVVFDCVGGPLFEIGLNLLGMKGRQVNITSAGGRRVSFDLVNFYHRQLSLYGVDSRPLDTVASGAILESLKSLFEQKVLTAPSIARTCRLEEAVDAYREVGSGKASGKVVIVFE